MISVRIFTLASVLALSFVIAPIAFAQTCVTNNDCVQVLGPGASCNPNSNGGNGQCIAPTRSNIDQTSPNNLPTQTQTSPNNVPQNSGSNITLLNPLGSGSSLTSFVNNILGLIINTIAPIIIVFMVVYTGFKFVVAQGNESKLTEARQMLMWTLVGALILLGAKAISLAIQATVQGLSGS